MFPPQESRRLVAASGLDAQLAWGPDGVSLAAERAVGEVDGATGHKPAALAFGRFRLDVSGRRLTEAGQAVALGGRALDLLIALVERPGELVTKAELMARAWPDTNVEDANLRVQIAAIRRALGGKAGAAYIAAASGRGYRFVAPLEPETVAGPPSARQLPTALTETIGREADIAGLSARLTTTRLLTIVGPGGIGKTSLAIACARALKDEFADGVAFVEVTSGGDLAIAVAAAFGLRVSEFAAMDALASCMAPLELLLVLDCCESAIEASTRLAEAILRWSPNTIVLCTSREPLRAAGEAIWRIEPLATPAVDQRLSAEEAMTYSAVRLFVDRASAADHRFSLTDAEADAVSSICRRLDGLPLAIELAAGSIAAFGLGGLVAALDNRFQLLLQGRRTAMPRHRTLAAAIDWSYDSLTEDEQRVLRSLSLFQGPFDADAAAHLSFGPGADADSIYEVLSNLVAKSIVMADLGQAPREYRLLDSTRDYARQKLDAAGELNSIAARHAACTIDIFKRADAELEVRPMEDWLNHFNRKHEDARAALNWAYAPHGDRSYAAPLTLAAVPVWMRLARFAECWRWIEAAMAVVEPGSVDEMALDVARGCVAMSVESVGKHAQGACERAIELAVRFRDPAAQLKATWALWNVHISFGRVSLAHENAVRFSELVASHGGAFERLVADRATGVTELLRGNLAAARIAIERVRTTSPHWHARERLKWYAYDPDIMARNTLVSLLWLEGKPDSAIAVAQDNATLALANGNDNAAPAFLADAACGMAIMIGDHEAAERCLTLLDVSIRGGAFPGYRYWAAAARAALAANRGDVAPGLVLLDEDFEANTAHPRYTYVLAELAERLGAAGAIEPARRLADRLLRRVEERAEYWILSEVQRIRAQLCDDDGEARSLLQFALDTARAQGARAWELRAATSLARRWPSAAREVLAPVVDSFTEGHGTRDLRVARQVLGAS